MPGFRGRPGSARDPMRSVVFVAPLAYVASMSFFVELIETLAAAGVRVHVITVPALDPPLKNAGARIDILQPAPLGRGRWARLRSLWWMLGEIRRVLRRDPQVEHVFGLSQLGLALCLLALTGRPQQLVYLNDELWFNDHEKLPFYGLRKWLERRGCARAAVVVTQDRDRGRLLACINGFPPHKLAYLPNSRRGAAMRRRTHLLHDLLGCPRDVKIVLWMGAVSEGDGSLEIARQAVGWPRDFLFVYHFRSKAPTPYKRCLIELAGRGRNRIVDRSFEPDEIEDAYASAHVGVVFYPGQGINSEYIGASSGKLNMFLKAGVPCLVSRGRGLAWATREAGCEAIDSTEGLLQAVRRLEDDYDDRSSRAVATYNRRLSFDPAVSRLLERLEAARDMDTPP